VHGRVHKARRRTAGQRVGCTRYAGEQREPRQAAALSVALLIRKPLTG
jgi:hypothetical protein